MPEIGFGWTTRMICWSLTSNLHEITQITTFCFLLKFTKNAAWGISTQIYQIQTRFYLRRKALRNILYTHNSSVSQPQFTQKKISSNTESIKHKWNQYHKKVILCCFGNLFGAAGNYFVKSIHHFYFLNDPIN